MYFAELGRSNRHLSCSESTNYKKVESDLGLTQWDFYRENGVLMRLDNVMSSTYSLWPSSEIKKKVDLNFYELPLGSFKLECWQ